MDILLIRLDAPLFSFGGPIIDNFGVIQEWPSLSMMTGLLANALGYDHSDADLLSGLQQRIRYAVRCDKNGGVLIDFQTVDLGQKHMMDTGWTTWGKAEVRGGGTAKAGTHIRLRHYFVDSIFTVALTLSDADMDPTLIRIENALNQPSRPLFIGRKCCIPSAPLVLARCESKSLLDALKAAELPRSVDIKEIINSPVANKFSVYIPSDEPWDALEHYREIPVTDERDWINQLHTGVRFIRHGHISLDSQVLEKSAL